jgi:type II secretory pathway pseudopilin PulG
VNERIATTRRVGSRGIALLEVLIALALFTAATGTIVGVLISASRSVERMRTTAVCEDLAVTTLSEIRMGLIQPVDSQPEPFEQPFDMYYWELSTSEGLDVLSASGGITVTVTVTHDPSGAFYTLSHILAAEQEAPGDEYNDGYGDRGGDY